MSRRSIVPSFIESFQFIIERIVIGLSHIAPIILSRPASILFAIAISPSLLRSSTAPISLKYNLTGSSVFPVCFFSSSELSSFFFDDSSLAALIRSAASFSETIFMLLFFRKSSTFKIFSGILNFFGIAFSIILLV